MMIISVMYFEKYPFVNKNIPSTCALTLNIPLQDDLGIYEKIKCNEMLFCILT